jgi:hypothetical protein
MDADDSFSLIDCPVTKFHELQNTMERDVHRIASGISRV